MTRRSPLAVVLAIVAAISLPAAAVAQVNPVFKQDPVTGNATQQQQITVPNGYSDTYNSGATLHCNGCTLQGFPAGTGNVTGPASSTTGDLPNFSDATGKVLSDSGIAASGVVAGPASATSGNVAEFNGATGKLIQNGPAPSITINSTSCNLGGSCTIGVTPSPLTNSIGADILLNNVSNYFDGPSVAQGTSGTWFASGTCTFVDTNGLALISEKLWDGTTVIASTQGFVGVANTEIASISVSGFITSPAGNIRISAKDISSTGGKMLFNQSGNSKDCTITAYRIQ